MKILISPYSRALRNGKENPKNYPYWQEVIDGLISAGHHVTQLGAGSEPLFNNISLKLFNLPLKELEEVVDHCDVWIGVDNFFQHFCHLHNKPGIVLFSQSNPKIFGHPENINLLKDEKYLREKQFDIWEACPYNLEAYTDSSVVLDAISNWRT